MATIENSKMPAANGFQQRARIFNLTLLFLDPDREGRRVRINEREGIGDLRRKGEGSNCGRKASYHT
ncbi:MAG: hypothetical protein ABI604_19205, partial [Nitrospirota bacterium]